MPRVSTTFRTIVATLAELRPEDLYATWRYADLLEEIGEMSPQEARRWKEGVFGLMVLWGLEPDEVDPPIPEQEPFDSPVLCFHEVNP